MIPPDGLKHKLLDEVINGIPPNTGCEILDGKYTDDEWNDDKNKISNKSEDRDSTSNTMPECDEPSVACTSENESTPVNPELKADLECFGSIEFVITTEKKESSTNFFRFWLRLKMF